MHKKQISGLLLVSAGVLLLASCQIAPINASTTITNTKGAGSKTLSALVLVDGSCQIQPDTESFPGNANYYYVDDVDFSNPTITPKADGAKVKMVRDGYLTNPNSLDTTKAVWEEFNDVVKSYIPAGFEFNVKEVQSSDWDDKYMDEIPDASVSAWKGYVYQVTYSWDSVEEYISKTKTLVGDSYSVSHLAELEDEGTPWATFAKNEDGTYTWSEAYLVNYWSVYDVADKAMSSTYFNRAALGADYAVTTDNAFAVAMQQYKVGNSDPVTVKIDNMNGVDENMNPKFISATGEFPAEAAPAKKGGCGGSIAAASGLFVLVGAVGVGVALKRKKENK